MKNVFVVLILTSFFISCQNSRSTIIDKLAGDNCKYWILTKVYPIKDRLDVLDDDIYTICLDRSGEIHDYFRGSFCAPIYKQEPDYKDLNLWELLNDSTIIMNKQNYKIEHLSDDMMILSFGDNVSSKYYFLYIKAPDDFISVDGLCNIDFSKRKINVEN